MCQMIGFKLCNFQLLSFEIGCQMQKAIIFGRHEVTRNEILCVLGLHAGEVSAATLQASVQVTA
jgi:hypothetical protein